MEELFNLNVGKELMKYCVGAGPRNMLDQPGVRYRFVFPNHYGASVVRHYGSYGYPKGLYELALLAEIIPGKYELAYLPIVGHDVLGYLTDAEVETVLRQIMEGRVNEDPDIWV